jgi:hypothetical protein
MLLVGGHHSLKPMAEQGTMAGILKAPRALILQDTSRDNPTQGVRDRRNQACRQDLWQQALSSTGCHRTHDVCQASPAQDFLADFR